MSNKKYFKSNDIYKFIEYNEEDAYFYFSTADYGLDFNKNSDGGKRNLENLKEWFSLDDVGYLNQIHSDTVHVFDKNVYDGDALLTDKKNVAIGVFTADCVPILIYDKRNKAAGAVHSGWKGTYKQIVIKTIRKMNKYYGTKNEDLIVYIGPHNMECCYEVGEELIEKFKTQNIYKNFSISTGKNISMKDCIRIQLRSLGLENAQIKSLDICTYCNKEVLLHSYRKEKELSGRMFSFICIK